MFTLLIVILGFVDMALLLSLLLLMFSWRRSRAEQDVGLVPFFGVLLAVLLYLQIIALVREYSGQWYEFRRLAGAVADVFREGLLGLLLVVFLRLLFFDRPRRFTAVLVGFCVVTLALWWWLFLGNTGSTGIQRTTADSVAAMLECFVISGFTLSTVSVFGPRAFRATGERRWLAVVSLAFVPLTAYAAAASWGGGFYERDLHVGLALYSFVLTGALLTRRLATIPHSPTDHRAWVDRFARLQGLSPRESEVMELFLHGMTSHDIAAQLFISFKTVNTHIHNSYKKCGVRNRYQFLSKMNSLPET